MRWAILLLCLVAAIAVKRIANAQDHQHHHPLHMDFYQHWRDPANPSLSCCNARVEKDGMEVGDCEPSKAEVRNGAWYVWIRQTREWLQVPDSKVLREKNPNTFDAHVCWTQLRGIICFVPPDTGG
jgi:hypothetical protein